MTALPPRAFERLGEPTLAWLEQRLLDAAHGAPEPIDLTNVPADLQPVAVAANALIARSQTVLRNSEVLALRDSLTGLPNRVVLRRFMEAGLRKLAHVPDRLVALLYFDLDHFKAVNDSLGHAEGDRLLRLATQRVEAVLDYLPPQSVERLFARIGGDEFAVCLIGPDALDAATMVARRILGIMREPFELAGGSVSIGTSIGLALAPEDGGTHDDLLCHADTAMYHAKEQGRNQIRRFHPVLNERAQMRLELATQLRKAIEDDEFVLHFQPQYRKLSREPEGLAGVELIAAEALLRWQHPRRGLLQPGSFIGVAEDMNLIGDIGRWVLGKAMQTITQWHQAGIALRLSVNISPSELASDALIEMIRGWLEATATPPYLLELEVTETHVMSEDPAVTSRLIELRRLGITLAIDDFGTGYSNLARLAQLPVDRLKLDRSLLCDIASRSDQRTIVQSVIHLARGIDLAVIAEGVETERQADLLFAMGCDAFQGFLFGKPVPEAELIAAWHGRAVA